MKLQTEKDIVIETILEKHKNEEGNVTSLLYEIQDAFGYIPEDAVSSISKKLEIPESKLYGVITFYPKFHLKPRGENVIAVCRGTACHVKSSEKLLRALRKRLKLTDGKDTTDDGRFTVDKASCAGTCSMAPVVIINKKVYGKMTVDKLLNKLKILMKKYR